ncbi:LytR/AlgR family response regulator transcription factor [Paenibacillus sp. GM2]|uniref:LytR/AlgR family response regulator transcription factor n=1 Tax=Paenibacillus sp. GM2 TaxID=1622070 RepID=UPI0008399CB9|nr:LytTR family DNA-binding domain-containing protein [Paenibacillus sp. GM2]
MITIFLCDDNKETLDQYAMMIGQISSRNNIDVSISSFYSGEELLFHLSDFPNQADIIYLDILMRQMNGMDTAKKLRQLGCKSEIIFLTTSEDYVYEAFDIAAVQYLLKSSTPSDKFEQVFLRAVSMVQQKTSDLFICGSGSSRTIIPIKDIAYFEIWKRIVTVHYSKNKSLEFYSTMEQLGMQLAGKNFVRVHRSYLVNLRYITWFHQNSLVLKTGENIPIGVTYMKDVRKTFADYVSAASIHGY